MKVQQVLAITSRTAFLKVHGVTCLSLAARQLRAVDPSQRITAAVNSEMSQDAMELLQPFDVELVICEPTDALDFARALVPNDSDLDAVLIHDASRPFVDHEQFVRVLAAFNDDIDAVRPSMPFTETLKILNAESVIQETLDRSIVLRISTPELIRTSVIDINGADCGWFLPLKKNARVIHVEGNPSGQRINSPSDAGLMELLQD